MMVILYNYDGESACRDFIKMFVYLLSIAFLNLSIFLKLVLKSQQTEGNQLLFCDCQQNVE